MLAATITALDDANNTLAKAQLKIYELEVQNRMYAAALNDEYMPNVAHEVVIEPCSPPPKRPCYGSPDARAEDLGLE